MAFVDHGHSQHGGEGSNFLHQSRPSSMNYHFVRAVPPPGIPPPPSSPLALAPVVAGHTTIPPANQMVYSPPMPFSSFCPNCHFQQQTANKYSNHSRCTNCNIPLPPPPIGHPMVTPALQHIATPLPNPLNYTTRVANGLIHSPQQALTITTPNGGEKASPSFMLQMSTVTENSSASEDRFIMTSIVQSMNDMLLQDSNKKHSATNGISNIDQPQDVPRTESYPVLSHSQMLLTSPATSTSFGLLSTPSPCTSPPDVLCSCGNHYTSLCMDCHEYLCASCANSHKHTCPSKTDPHIVFTSSFSASLQDAFNHITSTTLSSLAEDPILVMEEKEEDLSCCVDHPEEKLAYFCVTCSSLHCKSCVNTGHAHHKSIEVSDAYLHYRLDTTDLLRRTQMEVGSLKYSLSNIKQMNSLVSEKEQEAVAKVKQIFQSYREAVSKQEKEMIGQINDIAAKRTGTLQSEEAKVSSALEMLERLSLIGKKAIHNGKKLQALVSHYKLKSELKKCQDYVKSLLPQSEDDSFVVQSTSTAALSSLKSLCLVTTAPYPPHCSASGEGLFHPRINRLCTVVITTKDRAGNTCADGGEQLFVQLKLLNGNPSGTLPVDCRDNFDGSYSINFRPVVKGEHQLVVTIRCQHIKGSPFSLFVDGGREYSRFGPVSHVFGSEGSKLGQFCRPWGVCCDQQGNIIIGDRSNHRIQVFEANGVFKHTFGCEGIRPGQFNRPAGVAVTPAGDVVVADKDNHRIQVLKIDGTFVFMFGSKGGNDGQMIYPYDVSVNQSDGRIAVTDTGNHRLLIFSHDGILLGKFGYKGYLCGHFDSPRGIAFNEDGHIIVSDFNVHHILVIHPDGTTARILGSQGSGKGQFMRPQGIAVDHMGNFIVADTRNNRIVIMQPNGQFVAKFGMTGSGPGQFDRPTSVAVLPDGHLVVVDFGHSRIQIF